MTKLVQAEVAQGSQLIWAPSPGILSMHLAEFAWSSELRSPRGKVYVAGGGNFNCPIPGPKAAAPENNVLAAFEDDLSRAIVDCEVNSSAWTLMHRYNKATELLDSVLNVSCLPSATPCWYFVLLQMTITIIPAMPHCSSRVKMLSLGQGVYVLQQQRVPCPATPQCP